MRGGGSGYLDCSGFGIGGVGLFTADVGAAVTAGATELGCDLPR